jgi:hypothetical protein
MINSATEIDHKDSISTLASDHYFTSSAVHYYTLFFTTLSTHITTDFHYMCRTPVCSSFQSLSAPPKLTPVLLGWRLQENTQTVLTYLVVSKLSPAQFSSPAVPAATVCVPQLPAPCASRPCRATNMISTGPSQKHHLTAI